MALITSSDEVVNADDDLGMLRSLVQDAETKALKTNEEVDYQIALALSNRYLCAANELRLKEKAKANLK
ncbi:hypothetical protein [Photobacterium iliopiscarium]|uniref:hypothetical protein n=1 Tax=Photobacterium iliopiscarium TaxID=56192 RepID=UPI001E5D7A5A|nr:hypothetical protein [Photobacterium iliopiscarium]MCD9489136.1 hypothetical protein [Photobacterium iliopiscarium]MCF2245810.1 hypothetical protein [Photobacterium iliopiscarium]